MKTARIAATTVMLIVVLGFAMAVADTLEVTQPVQLTDSPYHDRNPSFYEASDGTWWIFFARGMTDPAPANPDADDYKVAYLKSTDQGVTWIEGEIPIAPAMTGMGAFSPDAFEALGNLYVMYMEYGDNPYYYYSSDNGATWSAPIEWPLTPVGTGNHSDVLSTPDGKVHFAYHGAGNTIWLQTWNGAGWGAPQAITTPGLAAATPHLAYYPTYNLIVLAYINSSMDIALSILDYSTGYPVFLGDLTWYDSGEDDYDPAFGALSPTSLEFYFGPYTPGDDRQWLAYIDGLGNQTSVTAGGYGPETWWDFWPETDPLNHDFLIYTSMKDGTQRGDCNIWWYPQIDWVLSNDHFEAIQPAVDAASDGDSVYVHAGTYEENVVIATAGIGLWTDQGAIIDGGALGDGVAILGDRVTLEGFLIQNGYDDGISLENVENAHVLYNDVSGAVCGIYLENSDMNEILGNELHDNPWYGIQLYGSDVNSISGNTVYLSETGIHLLDSDGNTLTGNVIYDTAWEGIYLSGWSSGNAIEGNTVYNGFAGIVLAGAMSNAIGGNVVFNQTYGMYLYYGDGTLIELNDVSATAVGIWLCDSHSHAILGNYIHGNDVGIYQESFSIGNQVHGNAFVGNTTAGVWNDDVDPMCIIDATLNWWGSPSGPSGVGPGTGDGVSPNVIYSPWLGIGTDAEPGTVGWQPVSPMLIIVDDIGPPPPAGYLNTAIDAANMLAGHDTIEVRHGTYDASEPITDSVTIVSETGSTANTFINGPVDIRTGDVLLGRMRQGFTFYGPIAVGAGVDASTVHINWNNIYDVVTNAGLNTLDATFNFWGSDGPDTVGDVATAPFLPLLAETIIGYIDEGLTIADALGMGTLVAAGATPSEIAMAFALRDALGFSLSEAILLIQEYGYALVSNALGLCGGDYDAFLALLVGYGGPAGGGGAALIGGGAGGAVGSSGLPAFVVGETLPLVLELVHPITGEVMDGAFVTYTVARQLADGTYEIVAVGAMAFDGELGAFTVDLDTTDLEPGVYDIYLGSDDGRQYYLQIEILAE